MTRLNAEGEGHLGESARKRCPVSDCGRDVPIWMARVHWSHNHPEMELLAFMIAFNAQPRLRQRQP